MRFDLVWRVSGSCWDVGKFDKRPDGIKITANMWCPSRMTAGEPGRTCFYLALQAKVLQQRKRRQHKESPSNRSSDAAPASDQDSCRTPLPGKWSRTDWLAHVHIPSGLETPPDRSGLEELQIITEEADLSHSLETCSALCRSTPSLVWCCSMSSTYHTSWSWSLNSGPTDQILDQ